MCEILLRIKDREGFDPEANALSSRPGDVIVACDDGWPWTQAELTNPDWRVIKIPGASADGVRAMCEPVYQVNPDGSQGQMIWKRAKNFDITKPVIAQALQAPSPIVINNTKWLQFLNNVAVKSTTVSVG